MALALKVEEERLAAIVTFAVTASGIAFLASVPPSGHWLLVLGWQHSNIYVKNFRDNHIA